MWVRAGVECFRRPSAVWAVWAVASVVVATGVYLVVLGFVVVGPLFLVGVGVGVGRWLLARVCAEAEGVRVGRGWEPPVRFSWGQIDRFEIVAGSRVLLPVAVLANGQRVLLVPLGADRDYAAEAVNRLGDLLREHTRRPQARGQVAERFQRTSAWPGFLIMVAVLFAVVVFSGLLLGESEGWGLLAVVCGLVVICAAPVMVGWWVTADAAGIRFRQMFILTRRVRWDQIAYVEMAPTRFTRSGFVVLGNGVRMMLPGLSWSGWRANDEAYVQEAVVRLELLRTEHRDPQTQDQDDEKRRGRPRPGNLTRCHRCGLTIEEANDRCPYCSAPRSGGR